MKSAYLFVSVAVLALVAMLATPAHAQDVSITVDPASVEAPGSAEFTVVGAGYPAGETIFVLTCPGAEGDPEAVTADTATTMCDIGGMQQPTAAEDGSFTTAITGEVTDTGLVVVASTQGSSLSASHVVTVGGAEPAPTETPTETPTEAPTETPTATTTELPQTGGESGMVAIIGASIVIGGLLFVGFGRRLARI